MPGFRISLIGPHDMMYDGIRVMLQEAPDANIVGDSPSPGAALVTLTEARPDVVLLDARAPGVVVVPHVREIHARVPAAIIVVVAAGFDADLVLALTAERFEGYVVWGAMSLEALHRFLGCELDGQTLPLSLTATAALIDTLQRSSPPDVRLQSLTAREREVLALVGQGDTDHEIASALTIGIPTVRSHLHNIHEKLDAETRTRLIAFAIKNGLA